MKRPIDEPNHVASTPSKRPQYSQPLKARYRQHGDLLLPANPQDPAVLDELLDRTLALILHQVGFDAVKKDALQSLRNLFEEHFVHLTHLTQTSVKNGRRAKVQPHDVEFALRHDGIRLDSLLSDLPVKHAPRSSEVRRTVQPPLLPTKPPSSTAREFAFPGSDALSSELGAAADKANRPWIPKHFPAFPPPHTYKSSSVPLSSRETDARKVRERATEEGVLAERALRKLVGARKMVGSRAGSRVGSRPGTSADAGAVTNLASKRKPSRDVFQEAMDAVLVEDKDKGRESLQHEDEMLFLDGASDERPKGPDRANADEAEDTAFGAVVNWDRGHWRSGGRDVFAIS